MQMSIVRNLSTEDILYAKLSYTYLGRHHYKNQNEAQAFHQTKVHYVVKIYNINCNVRNWLICGICSAEKVYSHC